MQDQRYPNYNGLEYKPPHGKTQNLKNAGLGAVRHHSPHLSFVAPPVSICRIPCVFSMHRRDPASVLGVRYFANKTVASAADQTPCNFKLAIKSRASTVSAGRLL